MVTKAKKESVAFFVLFAINVLLFFLIDLFTFQNDREGTSGNGNPALLFVIPVVPLYVLNLALAYRMSRKYFLAQRRLKKLFWILLLLLCACIYGEYRFVLSLIEQLGGGPGEPQSVIYRWGWMNQYTNTLFFNFYTFAIGILLTCLVSLMIAKYKHPDR